MTTASSRPAVLELRDVPRSDPWETIRRGRRLISSKVGLMRGIVMTRYQAQDPMVFCAGVLPSDLARSVPGGHLLKAGGAAADPVTAVASTIGEAAERHCAFFYDRDDVVVGSYRELAPEAVAPASLRLYSREQCERFAPRGPAYFDDDTRIGWVRGYSLDDRRPRLVPAALVYLNYRPGPGEVSIGLNGSTGMASGVTLEEAILSGLLEVVERDAFTLAWLHRQAGRRIEVDDQALDEMLRVRLWAGQAGVDLKLFDLTTDVGIPVVFILMRRLAEMGPLACVGSAARLTPRVAVHKCVQEAGQNFPYLRYLLESEAHWQPAPDFSNVIGFDQHFLTYVRRPELVPRAFAFWDEEPRRVALSELGDASSGRVLGDLETCLGRLAAAGYEAIAVDITTPDIAEVGFSVVRVIVPGLLPLHAHHLRPFLGVQRLWEAPARMGWPRVEGPGDLNPFPHPFP